MSLSTHIQFFYILNMPKKHGSSSHFNLIFSLFFFCFFHSFGVHYLGSIRIMIVSIIRNRKILIQSQNTIVFFFSGKIKLFSKWWFKWKSETKRKTLEKVHFMPLIITPNGCFNLFQFYCKYFLLCSSGLV